MPSVDGESSWAGGEAVSRDVIEKRSSSCLPPGSGAESERGSEASSEGGRVGWAVGGSAGGRGRSRHSLSDGQPPDGAPPDRSLPDRSWPDRRRSDWSWLERSRLDGFPSWDELSEEREDQVSSGAGGCGEGLSRRLRRRPGGGVERSGQAPQSWEWGACGGSVSLMRRPIRRHRASAWRPWRHVPRERRPGRGVPRVPRVPRRERRGGGRHRACP